MKIIPSNIGDIANTKPAVASAGSGIYLDTLNGVTHLHYNDWELNFNVALYEDKYLNNMQLKNAVLNRTGTHEIGHVLGLRDIDSVENNIPDDYHHEEILMGYSYFSKNLGINGEATFANRQSEITYKDIVGVAITRGYHTDNNHKWLYDNNYLSDSEYKIICSICNGVKYVDSLSGITYSIYQSCNNQHSLNSGNMFVVASYGTKDYYKCKYCRYVAPFTSIVS